MQLESLAILGLCQELESLVKEVEPKQLMKGEHMLGQLYFGCGRWRIIFRVL
jgi:hypothetical protein